MPARSVQGCGPLELSELGIIKTGNPALWPALSFLTYPFALSKDNCIDSDSVETYMRLWLDLGVLTLRSAGLFAHLQSSICVNHCRPWCIVITHAVCKLYSCVYLSRRRT